MYSTGEPVALKRDCLAVMIPSGDQVVLPEGGELLITQALGGSFTAYYAGNLVRIAGKDADALGKEPLPGPELPEGATDAEVEKTIWDQMKTCYDPEIPVNIVDLGLVYTCEIEKTPAGEREVNVKMTLTAPGCGMGDIIADDVRAKVEAVPTVVNARVEVVFDPPWHQGMMSEEAKLQTGLY
ncbi:MAG: putative Fe-S cluster assembly protein SufT [Pseudomonadota bacterium]|nr:putative Fe-S cluster assembly protein SufT [Pseudomonadota bacterium]